MSRYILSADYHLGHSNILKYANRPFATAFEMNEAIIKNHNERVKPDDIFIHNGDFLFKHNKALDTEAGGRPVKADEWLARLNGQKIMIMGNHDAQGGLKTYITSLNLYFANQKIHVVHNPSHADPNCPINLVGHVHQNWKIRYFKDHYEIIRQLVMKNIENGSDKPDFIEFLERNRPHRDSDSVLLNVGLDVQNLRPVTLDECCGQVIRFRKGITI